MISPFKGKFKLTSPRDYRTLFGKNEFHKGIDLVGLEDKNVFAVADGTVYVLYEKDGFGNYVRQHLDDGRRIYYAHLESTNLKTGDKIKCGDKIGVMGATGKVTGAHLHLELRPRGTVSQSLDICEFTDIPNRVGTYTSTQKKYSDDALIDNLMKNGIIDFENRASWELMLSGKSPLILKYVRTLFERCCQKMKGT